MKKTFLSGLLLFVAAVTLSGCSKDETTDPATTAQTTISATVEEPTRTALDGAAVKWVAGDKIMVANAGTATAEYTLKTGAGATSGTFSGTNLGTGAKFALYPYSATATCASGKFSFEMPAKQENGNVTFGNGANPMIAQSDAKGVLNFKNVCGAIRLQLKGTQQVSKIVVSTAITAEKLSGKAAVALNAEGLPVLTMDTEATNTVTLNCNKAQLNTTTATSFYVVVPAATYATGLQFDIYDETGTHIYSLPTTQALTITRSKVAKMPEKAVAKMNFPDPKFRAVLKTKGYTPTADGDIDVNDNSNQTKFTSTKKIDVFDSQIASLKGIEYFTGLEILSCSGNQLTSLDLSKNTALTELLCYNNQLQSLDVSQNTALINLQCYINQLPSLDLSKNTALTQLYCDDNQLTSLNTSACSMLTNLACGNQHADGGTGTTYTPMNLICTESQKALISLPTETQYNNNVVIEKTIAFPDPRFRAALVSSYGLILTTDETDIDVNNGDNKAKFTSRTYIDVSYKQIASLQGIEYFTGLTQLSCHFNQLTSLDLSKNTALTRLECYNNQLQSLNVSQNTALTFLDCSPNLLTSLDVSKNTALTELRCGNNKLKSLDVSKNTKLTWLYCHENKMSTLNTSTCSMLTNLGCGNQHADGGTEGTYTQMNLTCTESQKALISLPTETQYNNNVVIERTIAFPDPAFRLILTAAPYNLELTTDKTDIDVNNTNNQTIFTSKDRLTVNNQPVASLQGIEYFTKLDKLVCIQTQLTSLDVSKNTALTQLSCYENQLTSLDISKNKELIYLICYNNHLTTLDVSMLTGLKATNGVGKQTNAATGAAQNMDLYLSAAQMTTNLGTIAGNANNVDVTRKQK